MEYRGETKHTKVYDEEERKTALELAAVVGPRAASEALGINRASIYKWINRYPEYWSDLKAGDPAAQRKGFAGRLEDLADRYTAAEHDLLDRVEKELIKKADAKEAAALLKAMGSSRQAAVAGARSVSGEPTQVEHNINFPAIEAAMERLLEGAGSNDDPPPLPTPNLAERDG